jgi:nucleoporin NUP1
MPTRYRRASEAPSAIPEMLRNNKVVVPAPEPRKHKHKKHRKHRHRDNEESSEDEDVPRLGMKPTKKERKERKSKPYTGEAGVKKLLARRKQEEEEEEAKKDEAATPVAAEKKAESSAAAAAITNVDTETAETAAAKKNPFDFSASDSTFAPDAFAPGAPLGGSSLRIGRQKESRQNHGQSARPRKTGGVTYSASMLDADGDENLDIQEEKQEPLYKAPTGFSFAPPAAPATEVNIHSSYLSKHTLMNYCPDRSCGGDPVEAATPRVSTVLSRPEVRCVSVGSAYHFIPACNPRGEG